MIFRGMDVRIKQVVINDIQDTIYFARLFLEQDLGDIRHIIEVDARCSLPGAVGKIWADVPRDEPSCAGVKDVEKTGSWVIGSWSIDTRGTVPEEFDVPANVMGLGFGVYVPKNLRFQV